MSSWAELLVELSRSEHPTAFLDEKLHEYIGKVADITGSNVVYYASSFLQKPHLPGLYTSINHEDINGFMMVLDGFDPKQNLLLILHTPGGQAEASEAIMGYLRSEFDRIDALVPAYAMSAGTMIVLGCDSVYMWGSSQLGPIDPQLFIEDRQYSGHSIANQFEQAKQDILDDPRMVNVWALVLRAYGPLLQEAQRAMEYGENLVVRWLRKHMFSDQDEAVAKESAKRVASYFGGASHGSHGRRIDRNDAKRLGIKVVNLEDNPALLDAALTLYHLSTVAFEQLPATKLVLSSNGRMWIKNAPSDD